MAQVDSMQEQEQATYPPQKGLWELEGILVAIRLVNERTPDRMTEVMLEVSPALAAVAKAIKRGAITYGQLTDVRRRRAHVEKVAG